MKGFENLTTQKFHKMEGSFFEVFFYFIFND